MELPVSEIDIWALIFQEEQNAMSGKRKAPENRSPEEQVARFKRVMAVKKR